jgi:MFS family permease
MPRIVSLFMWFNFFTDFKLYAPLAILYFQQITGSFAAGMSIFSITMITAALFEVPLGVVSDRIGRKMTIVSGAVFAVLSVGGYASASLTAGQESIGGFVPLVAGAIAEGISRSFYSGNNDAMLHDALTEAGQVERFGEYSGKVNAMFQVALAISAVLGSIVAMWSFPAVVWISVFPQIACLGIALRMPDPRIHDHEAPNVFAHLKEAVSGFIHNKRLRLMSLASIWGDSFGESAYQFQSAFYATLWPVWAVGIAKVLGNASAAAGMHLGHRLITAWGLERTFIGTRIVQRSLVLTATAFPTLATPVIIGLSGGLMGAGWTAESTLYQRHFKPKQRATMGSLISFSTSLGFAAVAYGVGVIGDTWGPWIGYLVLQVLQLPALWWRWRSVRA